MITGTRLAKIAKTTIALPFLIAALLGLGLHARPDAHTTIHASHTSQMTAEIDPYPPGH